MEAEGEGRLTTGQAWQHEFLSERVSVHSKMVSPVLESPTEPASRFSSLLGACKNAYFATSFELVGLMVFPSESLQLTWWVLIPILDISEKE